MDVAITPSSPGAVPGISDNDEARRAQARKDAEDAQRRIDEQRAEDARQVQARQASRNSNGEVIGTTISTTA
jgi:hypothetical protein